MNLTRLHFLTAGESHGKGLLGILDGIPAGLPITEDEIELQLRRRQHGYGRGGRMKIETDRAEIYSGVRYGRTLGSPIGLILPNKDHENWSREMAIELSDEPAEKVTLPRPGHADLAGAMKFGFDDLRNVIERSSARETAMRVGLGAICRKLLQEVGIEIGSRVVQIYEHRDDQPWDFTRKIADVNREADASPVRCLDSITEKQIVSAIKKARKAGDSVGGVCEVVATGLPYGLGSYTQWHRKLPARLSFGLLSINAFKGIEFGAGFDQTRQYGSEVHDEIYFKGGKFQRPTNRAGGLEGGTSNAQPIVIRLAMKPIPTLVKPLQSVDINTKKSAAAFRERTDACAVPAASIVAEGMLAILLADALLEKYGGDSLAELKLHMKISAKY